MCLQITAAHRIYISNCRIDRSAGSGIVFNNSAFGSHVIEKCLIRNNATHGVYVPNAANGGGAQDNGNALKIKNNTILFNGGSGVFLQAGVNIVIEANDISSNGDGGIVAASVFGLTVQGNYFEDHKTGTYKSSVWLLGSVFAAAVSQNYMFLRDDGGELYGIYSVANTGLSFTSNFIQSFSGSGGTAIYLADGTFPSVTLIGNAFSGLSTLVRKPATGGISRYFASHAGDGGGVCGPVFGGLDIVNSNPGLLIKNELSSGTEDEWTVRSTNDINDRAYLSLFADSDEQVRFERESQMAFNDASLWLKCNRSGTITLSQVSIGALDSGGSGFRLLRVPNT